MLGIVPGGRYASTGHRARGAVLSALTLACLPVHAADANVQWTKNGLLSIKASGQPLGAVLRVIEAQTGIVIKGVDTLVDPVRWDLEGVPLVDGLRRLLTGHNYLIVEGSRWRETRVIVLGQGQSKAAATGTLRSAGIAPAISPHERAFADQDPAARIEAVERLGEQSDERSLALIRQATADPSDAVRAAANEALQSRKSRAPSGR